MELEDLKTRWEELSRRIERQQITTRSLLENTVRQRRQSIAAYTWFNLIGMILGIPILWGIALYRGLEHTPIFYTGIALLLCCIPWEAYKTLQLRRMAEMQGDIVRQERCTVRYTRTLLGGYLFGAAIVAGLLCYTIAVRTAWVAAGYAGNFRLVLIIGICALAASYALYRWEAGRIRALRRAMEDLKEFAEE